MKRLIMLAVLCSFVLSAAAASAADIKASGAWAIEALWASNWDFSDDRDGTAIDQEQFQIAQRATTTFEFIANENLKGVLVTRYGTERWGNKSFAIGAGDTGANTAAQNRITVRRAYVDFNYPGTAINLKAGYQGVALPNAFGGSAILDEEVAALVVSGAITDNVSFMAAYARAEDDAVGTAGASQGQYDVWIAALPLAFDGVAVKPFLAYGQYGQNNSNAATGTIDAPWMMGVAFEMDMFDPFVLAADLNYGKNDADAEANEATGWLFDIALEYKGMDMMTPEVFFAYSTGEDDDATNGSERMPTIAPDWSIGSFFFGGDTLLIGGGNGSDLGFWALGLSLKDIQSFADGLTHTAHLIYATGTNDKAAAGLTYGADLTEEDSVIEVDFNTAYKLYDELTLTFDLGYTNLDADSSVWGANAGGDAWKVSTGVVYQF